MDNGPGHTALTPLAFLERSAQVFPGKTAYVHGDRRATYAEFAAETTRLANALRASGIEPGDRVAYLAPNIPELLVAHFAVPLAGAVLVAINTRLAPDEIRYILDHSGAKALVVDAGLHPSVAPLAGGLPLTVTIPATGAAPTRRSAASATRSWRRAARTTRCPGPSGTRTPPSRSTTRPAPPGGRRASSTRTAAPTSTLSAR
ncbi:AMP-binding protein [Actinomadura luteofluorescens]|uniref:AMP-binding protein n=1 Tax=Actinomadura luteofluorescens TaxID=46163 RepID=UPI00362F48A8